jgi:hypothetical protein
MKKIKKFSLLIASLLVFTTSVFAYYNTIPHPGWFTIICDGQIIIEIMEDTRVDTGDQNISAIAIASCPSNCADILINYGYQMATWDSSTYWCYLYY